jgi:hypothetical protein
MFPVYVYRTLMWGHPVAQLVEALRSSSYEMDVFIVHNPFTRTMALGSTQLLREMSTRNLPGGKGWPARKADNLTAICEPIV